MKFSELLLIAVCACMPGLAPAAYEIVLPECPKPYEKTAADELRAYLAKCVPTGDLSVGGATDVVFRIGSAENLEDERWIIRSNGREVVIAGGGTRGTLYAVSHFLEDFCGVRWWSDAEEDVPVRDRLDLPALDACGKPAFAYRSIHRSEDAKEADPRLAIRRRLNSNGLAGIPAAWGGDLGYGPPAHAHTFDMYVPWNKYGKTHPEWYSLRGGKRNGERHFGQLCLSNPELKDMFLTGLREKIALGARRARAKGLPPPRFYEISMNDNPCACECDGCRADYAKWGKSGQYIRFVNGIASEIKKEHPELFITMLAYFFTEEPPKDTVAADNVIVKLCDSRGNAAVSLLHPDNAYMHGLLDTWKGKCANLFIWDYAITHARPTRGAPFASEFHYGETYRHYFEQGVRGIFWEHELPLETDLWEVKFYLESALLEDPHQDEKKLLKDAFARYFRRAARPVCELRMYLDEIRNRRNGFVDWFNYFSWLPDDELAILQTKWDAAEKTAEGDPVVLRRVKRARAGTDRLVLYRTNERWVPREDGAYVSDATRFDRRWIEEHGGIFDDPDSPTGKAAVYLPDGNENCRLPFEIGVYDNARKRVVAKKTFDEVDVTPGYHWYVLPNVTIPQELNVYLTRSWQFQSFRPDPGIVGKTFDLRVCAKFEGPWFDSGSFATNRISIAGYELVPKRMRPIETNQAVDKCASSSNASAGVEVRVRQTTGGPRIFVDGKPVAPRFYYGAPPTLCQISDVRKQTLAIPFRAEDDTDCGTLAVDGYDDDDPMWFSDLRLVDMGSAVTNVLSGGEEVRTRHFRKTDVTLRKGRSYRFLITHRATHFRTYFKSEVSYRKADGAKAVMTLPYGDTLNETVARAGAAGVDFVTFSTDTSWGCEGWWGKTDDPGNYVRIDRACEKLIATNPHVLFVPRVKADAPDWMLAEHPEMKMRFADGMTVKMSSVSSRLYRQEACRQVEMLTRHLRSKFPRNFAGLHVGGQNSAEWFYMMSQTQGLSGYDESTRQAFRMWLARRGEKDAVTAEVPSEAERKAVGTDFLRDPVKDRRVIDFHRFRQEEMASLLAEFGAAIRRGSDGRVLSLFFYGYAWELACVQAGASETGHYGLEWLIRNAADKVDCLSAPISYISRRWPGTAPVMGAAETVSRAGILWINENDNRTPREDIWDHMTWPPVFDDWTVRQAFLRDSAAQILRGYGDWWMDLFGRGWFNEDGIWDVRRHLNALDEAMLRRSRPYSPDIAICVNEDGFLRCGWGWGEMKGYPMSRRCFELSGVTYGQYLLNDVLANPLPAKVFYLAVAHGLTANQKKLLEDLKAKRPQAIFVERIEEEDMTPERIASTARRAGAVVYTEPGTAYVNATEDCVSVYSLVEGPIDVDFGAARPIVDFLSGAIVGFGPRMRIEFRKGETRIFFIKKDHDEG